LGVGRKRKMHTEFWWRSLKVRDHWKRHRSRWNYPIKMDLEEVWLDAVNWSNLARNGDKWRTLVNTAINHKHAKNFWIRWETVSFSITVLLHGVTLWRNYHNEGLHDLVCSSLFKWKGLLLPRGWTGFDSRKVP
jgi:hypothetical protein